MYADGTHYYYINGIEYTKTAYNSMVSNIIDYHASINAMDWSDECDSINIISTLNDIAINSMDAVCEKYQLKTKLLDSMKHFKPKNSTLKQSYMATMAEAKEAVRRSRELQAQLA